MKENFIYSRIYQDPVSYTIYAELEKNKGAMHKYFFFILILQTLPNCMLQGDACLPALKAIKQIEISNLQRAERLFSEQLFQDAIPLYKELVEDQFSISFLARLCQSYYALGQYEQILQLTLDDYETDLSASYEEIYFLQAMACKHLKKNEAARKAFLSYLKLNTKEKLFHYYDVLFELGLDAFNTQSYAEAKEWFAKAAQSNKKADPSILAQIYLARIKANENQFHPAIDQLKNLAQTLPSDHMLQYEIAYWIGDAYSKLNQSLLAASFFEKALPKCNIKTAEWYSATLRQLGFNYLKAANDETLSAEIKLKYFNQAENAFKLLTDQQQDEQSFFSLGECYLAKARHFNDKNAYMQAEQLFSKSELFTSAQMQGQVLLIRAESAPTYQERESLYRILTQESHSQHPLYAQGWYQRGINHFEEGQKLLKNKTSSEVKKIFEQAEASFSQAYTLLSEKSSPLALQAIKYLALALFHQDTAESRLKSWHLLESIISQFKSNDSLAEFYYLRSLIGTHIIKKDQQIDQAAKVEQQILEGLSLYPDSTYAAELLNLLGQHFFTAEKFAEAEITFLKLSEQFPQLQLAGEGLFWAAACAEKLNKNDAIVKARKLQVFEQYPSCPYAAEAYFSYYSYPEYLQGQRAATKHLQKMTEKFPKSPYLIQAYYLLGLDYKKERRSSDGKIIRSISYNEAIDAFQQAETAFDTLFDENAIPSWQLAHFIETRYRSTLERALANLAIAQESIGAKRQIYLEYAERVFSKVTEELTSNNIYHGKILIKDEAYPKLLEEAQFWLARTYIELNNDHLAENIASIMHERYRAANITKGYFLSRILFEQAMIAFRKQDYTLALNHFTLSENAAKGTFLSTDQRLDLIIQKSFCCRELQQYDQAMTLLSQVINDDAVSGLRLKAMYLRAELYELQGRQELAIKQWEAAAKKGGKWGQKAKLKLEKDYGYY